MSLKTWPTGKRHCWILRRKNDWRNAQQGWFFCTDGEKPSKETKPWNCPCRRKIWQKQLFSSEKTFQRAEKYRQSQLVPKLSAAFLQTNKIYIMWTEKSLGEMMDWVLFSISPGLFIGWNYAIKDINKNYPFDFAAFFLYKCYLLYLKTFPFEFDLAEQNSSYF